MTALELFCDLWAGGAVISRAGETLRVTAPGGLSAEQRDLIAQHKPALLALCDALTLRQQAMSRQLQPGRPLPFLIVRRAPAQPGRCLSCGEPSQQRRCPLCALAARLVSEALGQGQAVPRPTPSLAVRQAPAEERHG